MTKCERCKTRDIGWNVGTITMTGGAVVSLCPVCRREWHEYLTATPEWQEYVAIHAHEAWLKARAYAQEAPTEAEWKAHNATQDGIRARIYELSKSWLQQPVAVEE